MTELEVVEKLDAKIPKSAVSLREGGGRKQLSYLETWYVIDRMNQVLGHFNWSQETLRNTPVFEGVTKNSRGEDIFTCHYVAQVRVAVVLDGGRIVYRDGTGYGDGTDKTNPGKAHELAAKEAESDAFKRAAMKFGRSMGLALYSKDEEFLTDDDGRTNTEKSQLDSKANRVEGVLPKPAASEPARSFAKEVQTTEAPNATSNVDRKALNQLITEKSKVIVQRKLKTTPELKAYIKETFGQENKEALTDEQAFALDTYFGKILKEG